MGAAVNPIPHETSLAWLIWTSHEPGRAATTEAVHDAGGHVAELTFPDVRRADKRAACTLLCGLLGFIKRYADLKG